MTIDYERVWELLAEAVTYGEGCHEACASCPYAEECHASEGWWGCGVWEKGMGDDL